VTQKISLEVYKSATLCTHPRQTAPCVTSCRAQGSGKGVSIVEVAERCQDPKTAGPNIRPSSPRTVEAFLRSGFDPDDLIYKPPSYFKDRTHDDELAQTAFRFFEEGRTKRVEELRAARQALVDDGWKPGDAATAAGSPAKAQKDESSEDMVERERKRLEVLRTRRAPAALRTRATPVHRPQRPG
jgi:hypothetical protein